MSHIHCSNPLLKQKPTINPSSSAILKKQHRVIVCYKSKFEARLLLVDDLLACATKTASP